MNLDTGMASGGCVGNAMRYLHLILRGLKGVYKNNA